MGEPVRRRGLARPHEPHASHGAAEPTAGKRAAHGWLRSRGLTPPALTPWHVEISLGLDDATPPLEIDVRTDTRLRLEIYSEEWGLFFCHRGKASWIRVTDIPFVHGRDDFRLLPVVPALDGIGSLVRLLERQHALAFRRDHALIRTNVPGAEPAARSWVRSL